MVVVDMANVSRIELQHPQELSDTANDMSKGNSRETYPRRPADVEKGRAVPFLPKVTRNRNVMLRERHSLVTAARSLVRVSA